MIKPIQDHEIRALERARRIEAREKRFVRLAPLAERKFFLVRFEERREILGFRRKNGVGGEFFGAAAKRSGRQTCRSEFAQPVGQKRVKAGKIPKSSERFPIALLFQDASDERTACRFSGRGERRGAQKAL